MFERMTSMINAMMFPRGKRSWSRWILFLVIAVLPALSMAAFSYVKTSEQLTQFETSQKEFLAKLAATSVHEKLNNYIEVGTSLAMNPSLVDAVTQGDRAKAVKALTGIPAWFPFIDRLFVTDPQGSVVGDYPPIPGVAGTFRANQKWYRSVIGSQRPYVSEIFQRSTFPKANVAVVAIPIRPPGLALPDQAVKGREVLSKNLLGILVLQIKLDAFGDILKALERGAGQDAYLTDQSGQVVYHPRFSSQESVVDLSSVPAVKNLMINRRGAEILEDPLTRATNLDAFEPVPEYGWGVVVSQPVKKAFAERDRALSAILVFYGALTVLSALLAGLVLSILHTRVEGQEKLQDSFNLLQAIVEGTSDMVFVKDARGRYIMINSVGARLFGKSRDEIRGKLDLDLLPDSEARQFGANDRKAMSQGVLVNSEETLNFDGRKVILDTVRAPYRDHTGVVLGVIGVARDITERKRMEKEVQEAVQLKTRFVSIATHELRSPMTALYEGVNQMLEGITGPINESQKQILEITSENLRRMISFTTQILDFQRLDADKMPFHMKEEDLQEAVQTVYKTMCSLAEQKGLYFDLKIDGKLPRIVMDKDKIVQVLVNLINNAVKFTEKGGITLHVSREDNVVHISVRDTGPGMDESGVAKLFQPFGQIGSHKVKGTGLGLSISKEIVEGHHGKIWAEAKVGEGTAMHFVLPIEERRKAE